MADIHQILTPEDLAKIAHLQVLARSVVEGFTAGMHRSPHKGFSVEFKQHRQYTQSDEIRHVDWKLYGKTDRLYVREYEEETNLRATILLDLSGSMRYAGTTAKGLTKAAYATRIAACLSYLMLQQRDSVGLVTFDKEIRNYIPPRSRASHLQVLVDEMTGGEPGGETEIGKIFHDVVPKIQRRGLVIVLSDLFGDVEEMLSGLAHFRHAGHETVIFQIWDRDELEFPFTQWSQLKSLEQPGVQEMVDPALLRRNYMEQLAKFRAALKDGCSRSRTDLIELTTDQPHADALATYLASRRRR